MRDTAHRFPSYGSPSGIDQVGCPALTNLPGDARLYPRGCHHTSLLAFRRCRTSLCPELRSFSAYGGYYDHSAPPPSPRPQVAQSSRTEGDGSHVRALLLCDRVRPPLMPVRLTHNRRRSPVAHSPEARGVHPYAWAFGATPTYSRYASSPTIPIICGRSWIRTCHRGFLHVAIPISGRRTLRSQWDRLRAPLLPLGFRRPLPPCPPPARLASGDVGTSPLLPRTRRIRRFATHASWRTHVPVRTRPRTARCGRLCAAFGARLGSCLGLLLLAALSPRLGASLGGLPPAFGLLGQPLLGAFCYGVSSSSRHLTLSCS